MIFVKVVQHGDDLALAFPEEAMQRLGARLGDTLRLEVSNGSFLISLVRSADTPQSESGDEG